MIYCIMGYTSSGKDSTLKELLKITDIPKAISYTTRPMRPGETDGVEYHFVDKDFFEKEKDNFIEIREYKVWDGSVWYYGYHKNSFPYKTKDYFAIIEANGYYELCKYFRKSNIEVFYIESPDGMIKTRLKNRGDDPREIERRLAQDKKDFASFLKNEKYYTVRNVDVDITVPAQIIKYIIENL